MHLASECQSTLSALRPRLASHREHVLLVEPDADHAALIIEPLERHGYRVTWLTSAREALDLMLASPWSGRRCRPDLILLDTDATDVDVLGFSECVSRSPSNAGQAVVPLVLTGSRPHMALMELSYDVGATSYVAKPLDSEDLLSTVRRSLGFRSNEAKKTVDWITPMLAVQKLTTGLRH